MALTVENIRKILQLDFSYDNLIADVLPPFKSWLAGYTNNNFHTTQFVADNVISFDSNTVTISTTASNFISGASFSDGMDIHVSGSKDNDGHYSVDTVAAGTLTLADTEILVTEAAGYYVYIYRVVWPKGLLIPAAKMIKIDMDKRDPSLKSKSLADWSESYSGEGDYPPGLLRRLTPWSKWIAA